MPGKVGRRQARGQPILEREPSQLPERRLAKSKNNGVTLSPHPRVLGRSSTPVCLVIDLHFNSHFVFYRVREQGGLMYVRERALCIFFYILIKP